MVCKSPPTHLGAFLPPTVTPGGWELEAQTLHDDFVNVAPPFHRTPIQGIDQPLSVRIGIDKDPAFHLEKAVETLRLKLPDHGIKGAAHIGIDSAVGEARLRSY